MFGCKVGKEHSVSVCEGVCDSEQEREANGLLESI